MATRNDLERWVVTALQQLGGTGSIVDVAEQIWAAHELELRSSGDLFFTWQYDMRWASTRLRLAGHMRPAVTSDRGRWVLANNAKKKRQTGEGAMIDMEQLRTVLQGIGTLAALIKLRRESVAKGEELSNEQVRAMASQVRTVETTGFEALAATISPSTLDAIKHVIDRARKRYVEALMDPANTTQARDSEQQTAQSTICAELKRIKSHNNQSLPVDLDSVWREFAC